MVALKDLSYLNSLVVNPMNKYPLATSAKRVTLALIQAIHPMNVVQAAEFILRCEQERMEGRGVEHRALLHWLKESLQYYRHPKQDKAAIGLTPIEALERHLSTLLRATRSAVECLTHEAQRQLMQHLSDC